MKKIKSKPSIEFFVPEKSEQVKLEMATNTISAGFPSPAEDYVDKKLDLNEHLIKHPSATFFVKVKGHSMINAGINDNDVLIVDRSLEPVSGSVVIGVLNGEFTVKRISKQGKRFFLLPENEKFKPVELTEEMDFKVWGVVIYSIHKV